MQYSRVLLGPAREGPEAPGKRCVFCWGVHALFPTWQGLLPCAMCVGFGNWGGSEVLEGIFLGPCFSLSDAERSTLSG